MKVFEAKSRLLAELKQTSDWETKWKIKSNPAKISLALFGSPTSRLNRYGPIIVNGTSVKPSKVIKILGFNLQTTRSTVHHVSLIVNRAKANLRKLHRFKNAPEKIKKNLYKALIRPIIEYPSLPLSLTSKINQMKLQRVQNSAVRLIANSKREDRIKMETLHKKYKLPAMNLRLHRLAKKCVKKIIETYSPNIDLNPVKLYKYSDFELSNEPLRKRKRPILQRINKYIANQKRCSLYKLNDNWEEPSEVFT